MVFIRLVLYYIKYEKAGNFVDLLDRATFRKVPNTPISTHRMAIIFTDLTLEIFDHICSKNRRDPTLFTTLSVHLKIVVQLILVFPIYMIRTDISLLLLWHMTSQTLPRYHA